MTRIWSTTPSCARFDSYLRTFFLTTYPRFCKVLYAVPLWKARTIFASKQKVCECVWSKSNTLCFVPIRTKICKDCTLRHRTLLYTHTLLSTTLCGLGRGRFPCRCRGSKGTRALRTRKRASRVEGLKS